MPIPLVHSHHPAPSLSVRARAEWCPLLRLPSHWITPLWWLWRRRSLQHADTLTSYIYIQPFLYWWDLQKYTIIHYSLGLFFHCWFVLFDPIRFIIKKNWIELICRLNDKMLHFSIITDKFSWALFGQLTIGAVDFLPSPQPLCV